MVELIDNENFKNFLYLGLNENFNERLNEDKIIDVLKSMIEKLKSKPKEKRQTGCIIFRNRLIIWLSNY